MVLIFFKFSINDCPDGYVCNSEINKELNLFIPSFLNSIAPGSSSLADTLFNQISIPFPVFQWNSDYCSNCSNYSIRICEYKSNVHSTLEDAINDISILPTGSGYFDIGSSTSNIFQYPSSGFQILNEGSTYVWKVKRSYQTTNGIIEEFSIPFIFKMMNNQPIESSKNLMVNQSKLLKIKNLIGDIKFNEIFDENNGVLKDFDFTSVQIILNNVEKNEDYLDELLELINSSEIEIIEVLLSNNKLYLFIIFIFSSCLISTEVAIVTKNNGSVKYKKENSKRFTNKINSGFEFI